MNKLPSILFFVIAAVSLIVGVSAAIMGDPRGVSVAVIVPAGFCAAGFAAWKLERKPKAFGIIPAGLVFILTGLILLVGNLRKPGTMPVRAVLVDIVCIVIGMAFLLVKERKDRGDVEPNSSPQPRGPAG